MSASSAATAPAAVSATSAAATRSWCENAAIAGGVLCARNRGGGSVRDAEMLLAVIAHVGAGIGVEAAVGVAAPAEPFRAPGLEAGLVLDRRRSVGAHGARARIGVARALV